MVKKKIRKRGIIMTKQDMDLVLNTLLNPTKVSGVKANAKMLTSQQEDALYAIVDGVMTQTLSIPDAVNQVSAILQSIGYNANTVRKGISGQSPIYTMPFLIKQVLFYLSCVYVATGSNNQQDILNLLAKPSNNINVSHNFFTKLDYSPVYCANVINYNQPQNPTPYKGQKSGDLAVAIKYLVYQAGTSVKCYVDLFGGSGSASTAVCPKKNLELVYNELSSSVYNLFCVLRNDRLHKKFIADLKKLQDDLKYGEKFIEDISDVTIPPDSNYTIKNFLEIDFDIEAEENRKGRKGDRTLKELELATESGMDFYIKPNDYKKIMWFFQISIQAQPQGYHFNYKGKVYKKGDLAKFKGEAGYFGLADGKPVGQIVHPYLDSELAKAKEKIKELKYQKKKTEEQLMELKKAESFKRCYDKLFNRIQTYRDLEENSQNTNAVESLFVAKNKHIQYRLYKYFCFFWRIRKNNNIPQNDMVLYALAEFFLYHIETQGNIEVTKIARITQNNLDENTKGFLNKDYSVLIEEFHESIKNIKPSNDDAFNVLASYQKLEGKKALIYSDSPYSDTSDYQQNNVGGFTQNDMQRLIDKLVNGDSKFIFSCRAGASKQIAVPDPNKESYEEECERRIKQIEKGKEQNKRIYENVFKEFEKLSEKYKINLYVLALETQSQNLKTLIEEFKRSEIMITNYPISSILDINDNESGEGRANYKVYQYKDFMKILENNMNK